MPSTDRQNALLIDNAWQKIYRTFSQADFKSYDFDTVRRTLIDYLRLNYSESFNPLNILNQDISRVGSLELGFVNKFFEQSSMHRKDDQLCIKRLQSKLGNLKNKLSYKRKIQE